MMLRSPSEVPGPSASKRMLQGLGTGMCMAVGSGGCIALGA